MKCVNNTDINTQATLLPQEVDIMRLIELVFFAYRDFVATPDQILARQKFGRAHHRVLHFVNRNPGLPVADLLKVLRITKQSLARVLKDLLTTGYIEQRHGVRDRRQRLLHATRKGRDLALKLADLQATRLRRALAAAGLAHRPTIEAFLLAMVDANESETVERFINEASLVQRGDAAPAAERA